MSPFYLTLFLKIDYTRPSYYIFWEDMIIKLLLMISVISLLLGLSGCAGNVPPEDPVTNAIPLNPNPPPAAQVTLPNGHAYQLMTLANQAASQYGIDHHLFHALITQESNWNPYAKSRKGARGLTQIMPQTGLSQCGLNRDGLYNPDLNLRCGAFYLSKLLRRFNDVELALAAYNSGENRVARLGRIPRIRETQRYVEQIMIDWHRSKCGRHLCGQMLTWQARQN
jgi:hypothetical protein